MKVLLGYGGLIMLAAGGVLGRLEPAVRPLALPLMIVGGAALAGSVWLNRREWFAFFAGRSFRFGANAILYVLVVGLILVVLNLLGSRHNLRFDATEAGRHTLSAESIGLLERLEDDVQVKAFFFDDAGRRRMERLLDEFRHHSERLIVDWIDPDRDPATVKAFGIKMAGTTVFIRGDRRSKTTEISEEAVLRALLELHREGERVACFLSGHGEPALGDAEPPGLALARDALGRAGVQAREVELFKEDDVPADCDVLVSLGARVEMLPAEVDAIRRLLEAGGRVLVLTDPGERSGLDGVLADYGIRRLPGIVIDADASRRLQGYRPDAPVARAYGDSPIAADLDLASMFPLVSALEAQPESEAVAVVASSPRSWVESDPQQVASGAVRRDPERDRPGPVPLALQVARTVGEGEGAREARLVVFGDSDFATNRYWALLGNADLFLNAVAWLAGDAAAPRLPSREMRARPLSLTASEATLLMILTVVVYPLTVLGVGVVQWARRRKL